MQTEKTGISSDGSGSSEKRKSLKELTDDVAVDCFRHFGFQSLDQVLLLDMREYRLLCKAHQLKTTDLYYWSARNAFDTNRATLRKKNGHLVYPTVKKLFDYEKAQETALTRQPEGKKPLSMQAMRLKEYYEKKREEDNVTIDS